MNILVVEDNRVAAHLLVRTLEKLGHNAHFAEDGAKAWRLVRERHFDIVISDWEMPEMDGLELCKHIREQHITPYVYFVLLTAKDQKEDRYIGLQAGADDFLVKPLDPTELIARLEVASRILGMQGQLASTVVSLEIAQKRFSELFMGLPIAGITIDSHGRIQEWNRACLSLLGLQEHLLFERSFVDVICPPGMEQTLQEQIDALLSGTPLIDAEWHYVQQNGVFRHLLWNAIPLTDPHGTINGALNTLLDITNLKRTEQQVRQYSVQLEQQQEELRQVNELLQKQATTDGLTGLNNHRAFQEAFVQEFQRAARYQQPLSVLMIDVDHFKQYNDSFGHPAGDEVLKCVASILKENARATDYVARYGGEEFVIVLSNTNEESAFAVADRTRRMIEEYPWITRPITISLGLSSLRASVDSTAQLLNEADQALYKSKMCGRNRVTQHFQSVQEHAA